MITRTTTIEVSRDDCAKAIAETVLDTAEEYNEEVTTIDYLSHLIVHDLDLEGIAEPGDFDKHQAEYLVRRIT